MIQPWHSAQAQTWHGARGTGHGARGTGHGVRPWDSRGTARAQRCRLASPAIRHNASNAAWFSGQNSPTFAGECGRGVAGMAAVQMVKQPRAGDLPDPARHGPARPDCDITHGEQLIGAVAEPSSAVVSRPRLSSAEFHELVRCERLVGRVCPGGPGGEPGPGSDQWLAGRLNAPRRAALPSPARSPHTVVVL